MSVDKCSVFECSSVCVCVWFERACVSRVVTFLTCAVCAGVVDSSLRPLDRFMQPLLAQLKLRSSLYDDPNHHLDQATLLLQQATDAMDSQVSVTLLERVVKRLVAAAEADPRLSAIAGGLNEDPVRNL